MSKAWLGSNKKGFSNLEKQTFNTQRRPDDNNKRGYSWQDLRK